MLQAAVRNMPLPGSGRATVAAIRLLPQLAMGAGRGIDGAPKTQCPFSHAIQPISQIVGVCGRVATAMCIARSYQLSSDPTHKLKPPRDRKCWCTPQRPSAVDAKSPQTSRLGASSSLLGRKAFVKTADSYSNAAWAVTMACSENFSDVDGSRGQEMCVWNYIGIGSLLV